MKGFTILELLVVMVLTAAVSAMGMISFSRLKRQEDLFAITAATVQMLEKARNGSITGKNDLVWKVVINADNLRLEDGQSRVAETYQLPAGYSVSGPVAEIRFNRIDGRVETCPTGCVFTVQEVAGNLTYQWQILASGAVEY